MLAKRAGVGAAEVDSARQGESTDDKTQAVLTLALHILDRRGDVSDDEFAEARNAGLSDAEIAEVVGHVALSTLTNYFNELAKTEPDFPRVALNV